MKSYFKKEIRKLILLKNFDFFFKKKKKEEKYLNKRRHRKFNLEMKDEKQYLYLLIEIAWISFYFIVKNNFFLTIFFYKKKLIFLISNNLALLFK